MLFIVGQNAQIRMSVCDRDKTCIKPLHITQGEA